MLALTLVLLSGQIGSPHGVRLLDDTPLLYAQVAPPLIPVEGSPSTEAPISDAQVSAQQLQVDIDALKKTRPGLGGGIALISTGGTIAILGVLYLAISGLAFFGAGVNPFLIVGAVGLGIGLPLVAIGVWLLYNRMEERKRTDEELGKLKKQLQLKQRERAPSNPSMPPPPSDFPPPQVSAPDASMLIARF